MILRTSPNFRSLWLGQTLATLATACNGSRCCGGGAPRARNVAGHPDRAVHRHFPLSCAHPSAGPSPIGSTAELLLGADLLRFK